MSFSPVNQHFVPSLEEYRTRLVVHRRLSFLTPDDYSRIDEMCRIIDSIGATIDPDMLAQPDQLPTNLSAEDSDSMYSDDSWHACSNSHTEEFLYATKLTPAPPLAKSVSVTPYGPKQPTNKVRVCEIGTKKGGSLSSSASSASSASKSGQSSSRSTTPPSSTSTADQAPLWTPTEEWVPKHHILTLAELVSMQNNLDHAFSDCESSISSSPVGSPLIRVSAHAPEPAPSPAAVSTSAGLAVQHKALALFSRMAAHCKLTKKQALAKGDQHQANTVEMIMKGNAGRLGSLAERLSRCF